jgi:hypothetical protein
VLEDISSQGVGRIQSLFMYSLSFDEFLRAVNEDGLVELKTHAGPDNPIEQISHNKLIDYLKIYYIVGGMPQSVLGYIQNQDIVASQKTLTDLIETLRDDFAKYKKRAPIQRLREVFDSLAGQAGSKFQYSHIDSSAGHQSLKDALELLIRAGIAYKIYHTSAQGLPLGAQVAVNKFKVIVSDTGIHQKILGFNLADIIAAKEFEPINKGHIAEIFTGLEIIKNSPCNQRPQLYYWHRDKQSSNAEVDYVIQKGREIIPVEVKSGIKSKMQSMRVFLAEHNAKKGIRVSLENFSQYENIEMYPL